MQAGTRGDDMIVAVTEDLMLRTRLEAAAPPAGIRVTQNLAEAGSLAREASLLLVDLDYGAGEVGVLLSGVRRLAERPRVIGWVTHVRWKESEPLHRLCDRVVTRRDLVAELPAILEEPPRAG